MLAILDISKEVGYKNIITGDESYFLYDYQPHWWFVPEGERPPPQLHTTIGVSKIMLTVFLWGGGLAYINDTPKGMRVGSVEFMRDTLTPIVNWWRETIVNMSPSERDELLANTRRCLEAAILKFEEV